MRKSSSIFIIILVLTACSDKFESYKTQYTRQTQSIKPDYTDFFYWASHPWKKDPADSIPKPLRNQPTDSAVDVFFLHPTMYTSDKKFKDWNVEIDDAYHNAKTDYSTILYQASVFNQHARIFAPRYREAFIKVFFSKDTVTANKALELAYSDLKEAFEYYLKNWNNGRPIIIASHSQGSKHAERLLKEYFENNPLGKKLVAAYVIGWPVPENYFANLKMCADSTDINCVCSWRTFRKDFIPELIKVEPVRALVTNPLNWRTDETYASKKENKGAVLYKFNKVYKRTNDAQINSGVLWVKRPKFPWSFLYTTKNYHPGDINLFYLNIRENVEQRIRAYFKKQ